MSKLRTFVRAALYCTAVLTMPLFHSCTNVDSIMDDYNSNFGVKNSGSNAEVYTVENVAAESMLRPYYAVSYLTTLCLTAPLGKSYMWRVEVGDNAAGLTPGTKYTLGTDRYLNIYLLKSELKRWGSYKLTLSVRKNNGDYKEDTAWIYVY